MTGTLTPTSTVRRGPEPGAGGGQEPAPGGLLSVVQLQQALRIARRPDATPLQAADHGHPRRWDALPSEFEDTDTDAGVGDADADDLPASGTDDDRRPDSAEGSPVRRDCGAGRVGGRRRTTQRNPAPGKRRSRGVRTLRRLLGFDRRTPVQNGADAGPANGLTDLTDPASEGVGMPPTAPPEQPNSDGAAAGSSRRPEYDDTDLEVTRAPRGFGAVFTRWVLRLLLVVLLLAGANQLFLRPLRGTGQITTSAAAAVDPAAAAQAAARYTADYLNYQPGQPNTASNADLAADPAGQVWSGTGYLRADLVQPGRVVPIDPSHALVSVTARVRIATPPPARSSTTSSPTPTEAPTATAAAAGAGVPAGWTDLGQRWLTLVVPVETLGGTVKVSASSAVFTGEQPAPVPPIPGGQADTPTTTATEAMATAFFTAYAASGVSYLATPGVTLAGLAGTVRFVTLTDWTVTTAAPGNAAGPDGSVAQPTAAVGVGSVTWQLDGTDLQITQGYAVALTSSQHRWYASTVTPATGQVQP